MLFCTICFVHFGNFHLLRHMYLLLLGTLVGAVLGALPDYNGTYVSVVLADSKSGFVIHTYERYFIILSAVCAFCLFVFLYLLVGHCCRSIVSARVSCVFLCT